ncbi:MAG: hypothetical protein J2P46_07460 [Zavarzinella sp.]|nr:hypothetical protein [Zavarzinella sp.]
MRLTLTLSAALTLAVGGHAGPRPCDAQSTPVTRTDAEVVTLIGDVPPGGLFTDSRGVLYLRCVPGLGEAELAQAIGDRVLCVRMAEGQGRAELLAADNWAWPVVASRLTVREQPPPRPWDAAEAAGRTAAAKGAKP